MAWRFKVSKYKNAATSMPKKEDWVSDIKVGAPTSCGNHIKASAAFIAFNVENRGGGSLGLIPLDYKGRLDSSAPLIHGHSDLITDFDFSPFDDGMLATCSTDAHVRVWSIPEGGLTDSLTEAEYSLPQFDKRIENVNFHPTLDYLLTVAYFDTVKLWDIKHEKEVYYFNDHEDQVQSCSWKGNGALLATTAKDKTIRILDPRSKTVAYEAENHKTPKDSRVAWLGESDKVLSTGFDANRTRELRIRDLRNFAKPFKVQTFDSSTGTLIPLYDADTNMLFLAGKADVTIMYWEISDKDPYLTEGLKHNGYLQTKGACLVPKRGLNTMSGEVNRLLQLTSNAIIPLPYVVPRKTYREFHTDLFPDTNGYNPSMSLSQWLNGCNTSLKKISLDPTKIQSSTLQIHRGPLSKRKEEENSPEPEMPVPAPRSCISNGVSKEPVKIASQIGFCKPFVAVKPSFMPVKATSTPKPALRSSFPLPENKIIFNYEQNESNRNGEEPIKSLAQLKKTFEGSEMQTLENEDNGIFEENITDSRSGNKPLSKLHKNNEEKKDQAVEHNNDGIHSKLANIRKSFESRSISLDERVRCHESKEDNIFPEATPSILEEIIENAEETDSLHISAAERRRNFEQRVVSVEEKPSSPTLKRASSGGTRSFRRACKFRHLKGTPAHKSCHIDNIRDLNRTIPGECNGIASNAEFVVLPLSGAGGKLSVIRHQIGGRLPDGVIPSFVNGTSVLDFAFDPFNDNCLSAACDDGKIRLWNLPDGGLQESTNESYETLVDSAEKVTIIKWHPLSSGVMATACGDLLIKIWDLPSQRVSIVLEGHLDQIFSMDWSPCGRFIATVCRDTKIRIFDPRKSCNPTHEGNGPVGVRGARILWVLDGRFLVVCGFSKISERQVTIYKSNDLSKPLNTVTIDVNPAILVPAYDPDSSTLFVTGKGDSTIYAYEVGSDSPHLFPLSHHKCCSVHQGFTLLPKRLCDVRQVEFCRALRLTQATLEPLSFTVPRVKTELFQDDLFPPTQVTWEPVMTSAEWFGGTNRPPRLVSLQPPDMLSLSESRDGNSPSSVTSSNPIPALKHQTPSFMRGMIPDEVKATQHRLEESMNQQLSTVATVKDQDNVEGVDANEWDE